MRFRYLVYPEAKERLSSFNLEKRFKERDLENFPYFKSHLLDSELVETIGELKSTFLPSLDNVERGLFVSKFNDLFKDRENKYWKIDREGGALLEKVDLHDFLLMSGWLSSQLLSNQEMKDYKKFGFDSLVGFNGAVGATIWSLNETDFYDGYKWKSKSLDGRNLVNEITGDTHLDFKIYQTDITPDKTTDPLGNKVLYRPELNKDGRAVSGYHSVELEFLTILLKYAEQQKIHSDILSDGGMNFLEKVKSLPQRIGSATECFDRGNDISGFADNPRFVFSHFDIPIPILDENYFTKKHTFDGIQSNGEGFYGAYVGPNKELIFAYEGKERKQAKTSSVVFTSKDIDHLINGVFYQSLKGLGRTTPNKLARLLEYRFSDDFEKDQEHWRIKY